MADGSVEAQCSLSARRVKHDWYQTELYVVVVILVKNADKDGVSVSYGSRSLDARVRLADGDYTLHLDLAHLVDPARCSHRVLPSKVEVKLHKLEGVQWARLEGEPGDQPLVLMAVPQDEGAPRYPSSAPHARDWSRVQLDDPEGPSEGEAALNELFRKIYVDGSDEVKRAMNKSFQESGGTVLSTNWSEVSRHAVDVKPPDGLEWRKWD